MTLATDVRSIGAAAHGSEAGTAHPSAPLFDNLAPQRLLQYEVSRYIELLLGELGAMARVANLKHLLVSLETTRQEAADQTRRCGIER